MINVKLTPNCNYSCMGSWVFTIHLTGRRGFCFGRSHLHIILTRH